MVDCKFKAIIGTNLYNFSLEQLRFPPSAPLPTFPKTRLSTKYNLIPPDPPIPLILSYQNLKGFHTKVEFTESNCQKGFLNMDHICKMDKSTARCSTCGVLMKWSFLSDFYNCQDIPISYFNPNEIYLDEAWNKCLYSEKKSDLRKLFGFCGERPWGQGLEELFLKYNGKIAFPKFFIPNTIHKEDNNIQIFFDFEEGNLSNYKIIKEGNDCVKIQLMIRGDSNCLSNYFEWFFFKIIVKKPCFLNLEIINFSKPKFNYHNLPAPNPVIFDQGPEEQKKNWKFLEIQPKFTESILDSSIAELKFNFQIESPKEIVLSYTFPYNYSELLRYFSYFERKMFLKGIKEQQFDYFTKEINLKNSYISYKREVLTTSQAGIPIFLLSLTRSEFSERISNLPDKYQKNKSKILIVNRQHPIESAGSYVIEGILNFLMLDSKEAQIILDFYEFLIIPMVNPDGVMAGNNKTGISGQDFNRLWLDPDPIRDPEVFNIKKWLLKLDKKPIFAIDLHANSRKEGFFVVGNPPCQMRDWDLDEESLVEWGKSMLFSRILTKNSTYVDFNKCRCTLNKKNLRSFLFKELNIINSYNVEIPFFYYIKSDKSLSKVTIDDYKTFGKELCLSILETCIFFSEIELNKSPLKDTSEQSYSRYLLKMKNNISNIQNVQESWKNYFETKEIDNLKEKLENFVDDFQENIANPEFGLEKIEENKSSINSSMEGSIREENEPMINEKNFDEMMVTMKKDKTFKKYQKIVLKKLAILAHLKKKSGKAQNSAKKKTRKIDSGHSSGSEYTNNKGLLKTTTLISSFDDEKSGKTTIYKNSKNIFPETEQRIEIDKIINKKKQNFPNKSMDIDSKIINYKSVKEIKSLKTIENKKNYVISKEPILTEYYSDLSKSKIQDNSNKSNTKKRPLTAGLSIDNKVKLRIETFSGKPKTTVSTYLGTDEFMPRSPNNFNNLSKNCPFVRKCYSAKRKGLIPNPFIKPRKEINSIYTIKIGNLTVK